MNYFLILDFVLLKRYGNHNFVLASFCLLILLFFKYFERKHFKRQKEKERQFKNILKTQGIKITINSDKCTVVTKKYTIPNPYLKKVSRPSMMDHLTDRINYDEYIEVKECYIECDVEVDKVEKYFKSKTIKMDTKTLEIKLYLEKEITIYYNNTTEEYFFDLDFLYS
ncbi:hypothetical protein [uncultured Flavobacterium sp.]|uniref:hypothetical protein n=1 Tax=uncultured Flavobacterium sp. TaxID=165435 RepID=UPI0025D8FFDC|nr:hypothetical protein [uncultured Flavobacterium sp.]